MDSKGILEDSDKQKIILSEIDKLAKKNGAKGKNIEEYNSEGFNFTVGTMGDLADETTIIVHKVVGQTKVKIKKTTTSEEVK